MITTNTYEKSSPTSTPNTKAICFKLFFANSKIIKHTSVKLIQNSKNESFTFESRNHKNHPSLYYAKKAPENATVKYNILKIKYSNL